MSYNKKWNKILISDNGKIAPSSGMWFKLHHEKIEKEDCEIQCGFTKMMIPI